MAWFEDLQPCTPFETEWKRPIAVGWLAKGHPYARGENNPELAQQLRRALRGGPEDRWHRCEFCRTNPRLGAGVVLVPGVDCVYVAPELIAHYVAKHAYTPPAEFLAALRGGAGSLEGHALQPRPPVIARPQPPAPQGMVIESLEPVRLRPGMYLGSTTAYGLFAMVLEVVSNSFDEHLAGRATTIRVDIEKNGAVTVEDDGGGLPVGLVQGRPALEVIFTTLHFGPTFDDHHPHVHLRKTAEGVGIGPVSALSSWLEVETHRDGVLYRAAFSCGRTVTPLTAVGPSTGRGTRIRYVPDFEAIFPPRTEVALKLLEQRLIELAWMRPGLSISLQGKALARPSGLQGWVETMASDAPKDSQLLARGTVNDVDVEVALSWSPSGKETRVRSFANFTETQEEGTHVRGLKEAFWALAASRDEVNRVVPGIVAIVQVGLTHPRFAGPTRARLASDEARVAVKQVVEDAIKAAPWWWDRLHEVIK